MGLSCQLCGVQAFWPEVRATVETPRMGGGYKRCILALPELKGARVNGYTMGNNLYFNWLESTRPLLRGRRCINRGHRHLRTGSDHSKMASQARTHLLRVALFDPA